MECSVRRSDFHCASYAGPQPKWDTIPPLPEIKDNFTRTCSDYEGLKITTMAASVEPKTIAQAPKASTNTLYSALTSSNVNETSYSIPA